MKFATTTWAIVLAGGDGKRLAPLTQCLYTDGRPKPFARFAGTHSLLQATVERMGRIVPNERILVVAPDAHDALARQQLEPYPGVRLLTQPRNAGTGPGLLLPLEEVLREDDEARVIVTPSDHALREPRRLDLAITEGLENHDSAPVSLIGVPAREPSTAFGYIVPGVHLGGRVRAIDAFYEKPNADRAETLIEQGALWSTLVITAEAQALWDTLARHLKQQAELFHRSAARGLDLVGVYRNLVDADISSDVLASEPGIGVVDAGECGWSDLGTPEQVFSVLEKHELHLLLERLHALGTGEPWCNKICAYMDRAA